jgi:hypothetical protein
MSLSLSSSDLARIEDVVATLFSPLRHDYGRKSIVQLQVPWNERTTRIELRSSTWASLRGPRFDRRIASSR